MQLLNAEVNKVELIGWCMTVLLTTAEYTLRFPTLKLAPVPDANPNRPPLLLLGRGM